MITTKNHAKIGKHEFDLIVRWQTPLDDPTVAGNLGLEGFDEMTTEDTFDTRARAEERARLLASAAINEVGPRIWTPQYVELQEFVWVEETYDDILDATQDVVKKWWLSADGTWEEL